MANDAPLKVCTRCNKTKSVNDFYVRRRKWKNKFKEQSTAMYVASNCIECHREINNICFQKNKHKRAAYQKRRRAEDPKYRLAGNLRNRIKKFVISGKFVKKYNLIQYLGCTQKDFVKHLEAQFTENMNWDNYGTGLGKWNIDHKIPLSSAKNIEELYSLCHYSNLQPLWFLDNLKKSNKIEK